MSTLSKPHIIDLELTNLCNTECAFCPRDKITRPLGKMSLPTFHNVLRQLKKHLDPYVINLSGMGECLLHPNLTDWLRQMKKALPAYVGITTNGLLLGPQVVQKFVKTPPDFITISFSGDKQILRNITHLLDHRKGGIPRIHMTSLRKGPAPAFWKKFGVDGVILQKLHNRGGHLPSKVKRAFSTPCQIFNNSLFITWQGDVLSCCHDLAGRNNLGNLNEVPLNTILQKRQKLLNRINPFALCLRCDDTLRAQYFAKSRFIPCQK